MIQCEREDGRYMQRERERKRENALNERENMWRQLLFLVKYLRHI